MGDVVTNLAGGIVAVSGIVVVFIATLCVLGLAIEWMCRARDRRETTPPPVNHRRDPHVPVACGREGCGAVRPWQEMSWDFALGHVCPEGECQAQTAAAEVA